MRVEKGFLSWGAELSPDYSVLEPGLGWAVDWARNDFTGHDAACTHRGRGAAEVFSTFVVDALDADCTGGEPVFLGADYAGYVSSGAYGATVGQSLALGFLKPELAGAADYHIEINGQLRAARRLAGPMVDPAGGRMRG